MALKDWLTLSSDGSAHGIRPFGYTVQLSDDHAATWRDVVSEVGGVRLGYGTNASRMDFIMWDRSSISVRADQSLPPIASMPNPYVQQRVRLYVDDGGTVRNTFYGIIDQVGRDITDDSVTWTCSAKSIIATLDEVHITASFNDVNPLNPKPVFDPVTGFSTHNRRHTVKEIIKSIFAFKDAWKSPHTFTYDDLDWQGLEGRVGGFVPSELHFDNTPKGQAIDEVLKRVGNFVLWYDAQTGTLQVVEQSLTCRNCGDMWDLAYPDPSNLGSFGAQHYAHDFQINADRTIWTTTGTVNVVRVTSGPIRFYSGNHAMPEQVTGDHAVAVETDTVLKQKARMVNQESCLFRLNPENLPTSDRRNKLVYFVGAPMFPGWNIYEDWYPAMVEIRGVNFPPAMPRDETDYVTDPPQLEYEAVTRGQITAMGYVKPESVANMRVFQAWHAPNDCPACQGTGLVRKVYGNPDNEPVFSFAVEGTPPNQRRVWRAGGHIFNPSRFGEPNPDNLTYGLQPWISMPDQTYPLPWKNTCPACRGVGKKPEYRVRWIQNDVVQARATDLIQAVDVTEVSVDPEATATAPETWDQAQSRVMVDAGPAIAVETALTSNWLTESFQNRDKPRGERASTTPLQLAHPLTYDGDNNPRALTVIAGGSSGAAQSRIVPETWRSRVAHTGLMMDSPVRWHIDYKAGALIFDEPVFIRCQLNVARAERGSDGAFRIDTYGHLKMQGHVGSPDHNHQAANQSLGRDGQPNGFWRAPRVWLQYFFTRPGFHRHLDMMLDGVTEIPHTEFIAKDPEGNDQTYLARAMIVDGRYCIEVVKKNPSENAASTETSNSDRVQQAAINYEQAVLETTESDLEKMPVPPRVNMMDITSDSALAAAMSIITGVGAGEAASMVDEMTESEKNELALEVHKRDVVKLDYPRARMTQWYNTTPGEKFWEASGYTISDSEVSVARVRRFSWRLRDDRLKMMELAVQTLEEQNNVIVSGSLTLAGVANDLTGGMGWIEYPGRGRACVVGVNYAFGDGFTTTIEISREQPRYAETPVDTREAIAGLYKQVSILRRDRNYEKKMMDRGAKPGVRFKPVDAPKPQSILPTA